MFGLEVESEVEYFEGAPDWEYRLFVTVYFRCIKSPKIKQKYYHNIKLQLGFENVYCRSCSALDRFSNAQYLRASMLSVIVTLPSNEWKALSPYLITIKACPTSIGSVTVTQATIYSCTGISE